MKPLPGIVVFAAFALVLTAAQLRPGLATTAEPPLAAPASVGDQLRYIGRDVTTGMATTVDDGFIAEVERGIERYGKDERQALPPPPVSGLDVAALSIPALRVDAFAGRYGLDRFGRIDVPQDNRTVGWNPAYTSLPGEGGATFFAAHFEYRGIPGVFFRLSALRAGDEVTVKLSDGTGRRYRVTSTIDYALGSIDMGAILAGREGVESVTLMTCSGPANEGEYPLRTVVLAQAMEF